MNLLKNILLFFLLLSLSCSFSQIHRFKTDTFLSSGQVHSFEIYVPKGAKKIRTQDFQPDIIVQLESRAKEILYISQDISFANSPNKNEWLKCSTETNKCEEGQQVDGKFWKELLMDGLVVGYYDVLKEEKDDFDKSLDSFKVLVK